MLSKKDLIEINKQFHNGKIMNEGSFNFAVNQIYRSNNWLRAASVLSRAIIVDHLFEDGNKRTAAAVISVILELNKISYNIRKIDEAVIMIAKKNITSIKEIEKVIKNVRE